MNFVAGLGGHCQYGFPGDDGFAFSIAAEDGAGDSCLPFAFFEFSYFASDGNGIAGASGGFEPDIELAAVKPTLAESSRHHLRDIG